MRQIISLVAIALIVIVLQDAFETMVLPRRVSRRLRLSRLIFAGVWRASEWISDRLGDRRRESYLAVFGPVSLLLLLILWACALIFGFGMLQWGLGSGLHAPSGSSSFGIDLYLSGTTFFTLGLGDVVPASSWARVATVVEAGIGFGFLALVIGYLPMLYQAFARREEMVSLLDARAGSPPTAVELLRRSCKQQSYPSLDALLLDWERWAAQLLESQLSYPVLSYFRSQHEHQSWLAALTAILDACALLLAGVEGLSSAQARLTFAMGRHAVVDLSAIFHATPRKATNERLTPQAWERVRAALAVNGLRLRDEADAYARLAEMRALYEPYVLALSHHLMMRLPPWLPDANAHDAWETSADETAPDIHMVRP